MKQPYIKQDFFRIGGWWAGAILLMVFGSACSTLPSPEPQSGPGGGVALRPDNLLPQAESPFSEALAWFSRGLSHELDGNIPAALAAYQQAIEQDPENDTLYMIASQRLMETGEDQAAFELLRSLLERDPQNVRALRWLARLHREADEPEKALPLLKRAVALHPASEVPYLRAIQLELQQGNTDEMLRIARLAVQHADQPERSTDLLIKLLIQQSRQAEDLITTQRFRDEAEERLEQAVERFPETDTFILFLAEIRLEEKKPLEALALYETLDARFKGSAETRAKILIHFLRSAGGDARAVTTVRDVLEEQDESVLALYLTGLLEQNAGAIDRAQASFEAALERAPADSATQRKLALLYFQDNQPGRAARFLSRVLRENPRDTELLTLAAHIHLAAENYTAAARRFRELDLLQRQGVELDSPAQVQAGRAMALLAIGDVEGAVDAMAFAAERVPNSLEVIWRHQLQLAWQVHPGGEDRREQHKTNLLEALLDLSDRRPEDPNVEQLIASTYSALERHPEALRALDRVKDLAADKPDPSRWLTVDYYFDRGAALERVGRTEESEKAFQTVLDLDPDHAPALNYLAYMWAERGENLQEALTFVQKALDANPDSGAYVDTLGWVYYQLKRYEDAYRELSRASELIPRESVVAEHLGDVLMKLNRPVEALGYYRIALELGPGERLDILKSSLERAQSSVAETFQLSRSNR